LVLDKAMLTASPAGTTTPVIVNALPIIPVAGARIVKEPEIALITEDTAWTLDVVVCSAQTYQ
jgi:hypothetical protein